MLSSEQIPRPFLESYGVVVPRVGTQPTEHKARFRTFHNYFVAWQILLEDRFGPLPLSPVPCITQHPKYRTLRTNVGLQPLVTKYLRNAWSNEIALRLPLLLEAGQTESLLAQYHCVWAPVQAYYAVFSAMVASAHAQGQLLHDHTAVLNFAGDMVEYHDWVPEVFNFWCRGDDDLGNLSFTPRMPACSCYRVHNLSRPYDVDGALALTMTCLKTTRREFCRIQLDRLREKRRAKLQRPIVTKMERRDIDSKLRPTTLFDFLYRVRLRCNYQEAETFVQGPTTEDSPVDFLSAIVAVVGFSLAFLETVICGRIGKAQMLGIVNDYVGGTKLGSLEVPVAERWNIRTIGSSPN